MDHVKGALGPLASMVMEFPKLLERKKPSEEARELMPSYMESWFKENGGKSFIEIYKDFERKGQMVINKEIPFFSESFLKKNGGIRFIEMPKQNERNSQMELNKELESPDLKRDIESLYRKLTSLIEEGKYTKLMSEEVKVWAEARELSYDLEDVLEKFLVYIRDYGRLERLPEIDTLKKLMQKMADLQLGGDIQMDEMINDVAPRPASTMTIDARIQAFYTEIPVLVGMSRNMGNLIHMISDANVPKVTSAMSEKHSGTHDKFFTEVPAATSKKMSSNDPSPVPDDSQYEDKSMPSKIKPKVACVVGLGGLGKTTLVRTLYDEMKKDFSCKVFVTVGQNGDVKMVLMKMLLALDNEKMEKNYTEMQLRGLDEWQLTNELNEFLFKERYLIVIDDIWKENLWEFIKCAFHNDRHLGSQVFTTTRSMSVAKDCCLSSDGRLIYQMEPLSDEDSKILFYRRVFTQEGGQCHYDFKQVSEDILKKCGGVPLAINTIASLLGSNGEGIKPISEWNHLLKSIGSGLTEGDSVVEMNRILSLSYHDLPPELKNCLLYMVVFPEDYVIKKDHLVSKWIAEDFVRRTNQEDSLFEVAENYFNMLIRRSMIEPINIDGEGKAKACRVHDIVLGFLCSLSSEANFVTIIDGSIRTISNSETKIRRLSIQNTMATEQVFIPEHRDGMEHVRSFTLSSSNYDFDRAEPTLYKLLYESVNGHKNLMEPLTFFEVLRVLDLRDCCGWVTYHQSRPLRTDGLLHLRYLGLKNMIFNILPADLGNLKFLQILDLRNYNCIEELPSSIVELRELIYLRVDPKTRLPDEFGKLTSLEKLTHMLVNLESAYLAKQLGYLTNLRVLRITPEDMDENLAEEFVESLNKLLEIRSLEFKDRSNGKIWRTRTLQSSEPIVPSSFGPGDCIRCMEESWKPSSRLQKFWADNDYCFLKLPKWITESCNISSLSICLKKVGRKDIEILGRLQRLLYLHLTKEDRDNIYPANPEECFKNENEGSQSENEGFESENEGFRFDNKGFVFENDAFPVARELHIAGIVTLPAMFPKGAMPKVEILEFHVRLEDLGKMQLEMAHLPTLKKIKVIIWYKIDVHKVTNGAHGSLRENYAMLRNYVHEVIGVQVKDAEAALRAAADSHPNRPTTDIITRRYDHGGDLEKDKFKVLTRFLKIAEEEAAEKRIRFSDVEAGDVMNIILQRITDSGEEMSSATAFSEMLLRGRVKTTSDKGLGFKDAEAVGIHTTSPPLRVTEIGESSGLSSQPPLDPDDVKAKMLEIAVAEMQLSSSDAEAINVQSSCHPLSLTEIDEANGLPSLPLPDHAPTTWRDAGEVARGLPFPLPMDSDEVKLKLLLSKWMNANEEQILQEHRVVEESMLTKLAEERARDEVKASFTGKGKEKIIYISSDHDVTCRRQPLRLIEIGEGSGFPSMQSLDPDEDKFKTDEDGATDKLLCSSYVGEVNVKASHQPLHLTEIEEASGFPSQLSLDPDEEELKLALSMSMLKNQEEETTEKQVCSSDMEAVDVKASRQPVRLTEIGEASRFPSLSLLEPDEDELKFALLLSMSKNEDEEEIFQKYRLVEESMATKCGGGVHNNTTLMPLPHPWIPTLPSPRAPTLPPIMETRSTPMVAEPSPSGMTKEVNDVGLEVGIANNIVFRNSSPDVVMDDVAVVIDAEVTKGEATSKVNEAEITRPVAQELATTIAEITIVGTAAVTTATLAVSEEDPLKSKCTASISVKAITSHARLDSSREEVVYGQNIRGRLRIPYSSTESLDELELDLLSVMSTVRLAKEAVQYELDISRQEVKDLVLKNTNLDMALAAEKIQVEELKVRLAATEKIASENAELNIKIRELSELMKEFVETNKGLVTKFEEAKTEVESAAHLQVKCKDLQIIRRGLEIKDIAKSKHIDHMKKEHEDLQTKHKETINSSENMQGEVAAQAEAPKDDVPKDPALKNIEDPAAPAAQKDGDPAKLGAGSGVSLAAE